MLKEGVSDHCHERVSVKTVPGSTLEVIEPEFFFHLLVGLFTNPSRLDGGSQTCAGSSRRAGWRDSISSLLTRGVLQ